MTTTDYNARAQDFLDRFGIKFRATLSDSKFPPWDDKYDRERHHYRVTLSRPPLGRIQPHSRLTFDFWASVADAAKGIKTVTPYDVLACISSDIHCADTFKDFCAEFGESEDSIKALQTWRRCHAFSKRLKAFFTAEEIKELGAIQ